MRYFNINPKLIGMKKLIFFVLNFLTVLPNYAQYQNSTHDDCGCNDVLLQGIYVYRYLKADQSASDYARHFLATSSRDVIEKSSNLSGGASAFGFGLKSSMSDKEFSDKQSELKREDIYRSSNINATQLVEAFPDPVLLNNWNICKANCNKSGFHSYYLILDDSTVELTINWNNVDYQTEVIDKSKITGGYLADGSSESTLNIAQLKNNTPVKRYIKRTNNSAITISIDIRSRENTPISIYIPKLIKPSLTSVNETPSEILYTIHFQSNTGDALAKGIIQFKCDETVTGSIDLTSGLNMHNHEYIIPSTAFCQNKPLEIMPQIFMGPKKPNGTITVKKWIKLNGQFVETSIKFFASVVGLDSQTADFLFSPKTILIPFETNHNG